jgi:hypothetical protein
LFANSHLTYISSCFEGLWSYCICDKSPSIEPLQLSVRQTTLHFNRNKVVQISMPNNVSFHSLLQHVRMNFQIIAFLLYIKHGHILTIYSTFFLNL